MDEELQIVRRDNGAGGYQVVLLAPDGAELVFYHGALFAKDTGATFDILSPDGKVDEKAKAIK